MPDSPTDPMTSDVVFNPNLVVASTDQSTDPPASDTDATTVPTTPDATEEPKADDTPAPKFDIEALTARLDAAASKADLTEVKRQTGHIKSLQREIAELKAREVKDPRVDTQSQQINALMDALDAVLPEGSLARVRSLIEQSTNSNSTVAEVTRLLDERLGKPEVKDDSDDAQTVDPAVQAQAHAATAAIHDYARARGIDANDIPDTQWNKALTEAEGNIAKASTLMAEHIDGLVAAAAAPARRAEKAEAAAGGPTNERAGGSPGGRLTREQMASMTPQQLMKYPREVRDAALAAG